MLLDSGFEVIGITVRSCEFDTATTEIFEGSDNATFESVTDHFVHTTEGDIAQL
jgi:hypothetical protein